MKSFLLILLVCCATSCVAKKIVYTPNLAITSDEAKSIIEQILTEQPPQLCPESSVIAHDYIEMNYGTQTRTRDGSSGIIIFDGILLSRSDATQTTREIKKRIYYNTILECKIFSRGSWFISQVIDTENRVLHNFYCRNEVKAKRFSDALLHLKNEIHNSSQTPSDTPPPAEESSK